MAYIFSGFLLLLALILIGNWFARADPALLARMARSRWTQALGVAMLFGAVLLTIWSGAIPGMIALAASLLPFLLNFRALRNRAKAAAGPSAGQTSSIETDLLWVTLDHDSGDSDGEVKRGRFEGRFLSSMNQSELMDLLHEANREDPRSVPILEAYLDRAFGPEWREGDSGPRADPGGRAGGARAGAGRSDGGRRSAASGRMSVAEALSLLGLEDGASESDIKAAHRRLMRANHPDAGGTSYLAAKINEAKDVLLGKR